MKKVVFAVTLSIIFLVAVANAQDGWMTRYWDGCKQSCSWVNNGSKTCDSGDNLIPNHSNSGGTSSCDGGPQFTCWDMSPWEVSPTLAYGFVATNPPNQCGQCFELTFTGTGRYGNDSQHRAIQGKKMIVMAANIGGDVGGAQLDLLVPGGGLGQFNSFTRQTGISESSLGARYGGLLSNCETENNYNASTYKSCLTQKCNSVFSSASHAKLREGCLFYANWLEAAGNPNFTRTTVTCPQALVDRYRGTGGGTPTGFTLTVNRNPAAGGTTTPASTQSNIAANTNVNISATAANGYSFSGWTAGAGATITNVNAASTTVRLTANATITANFAQQSQTQTYSLVIERSPTAGGTVTPASGGTHNAGTAVSITANPASGYRFVNWTVVTGTATIASATSANTTVSLSSNATIRANFVQTFTLTVNREPTAGGTTTPASSQSDIVANTPISILATPASGYRFVNWTVVTGTATFANANNANTTVSLSTNATIRANFAQTFTLTMSSMPTAGGTTSPASSQANISAGTPVSISATANSGYTFNNWTVVSGTATFANANSATTTVTLSSNATIRANFTQNSTQPTTVTLTINRSPTAGGTVTPASGGTHNSGTPINIEATATNGYTFTNWTVTSGTATFANATASVTTVTLSTSATIVANFTQQGQTQTYTLTINREPTAGGTVIPASGGTHNANTPVNITATAASGYTFNNWTVTSGTATIASPNSASTTVTLSSNATISANFTESGSSDDGFLEFTVNITPAGSGRVDISPNKSLYLQGESITVTAVANQGFEFETWVHSDDLHGSTPQFNTNVWWHRAITAQFKTGITSIATTCAKTSGVRTRSMITATPGGFTAILPADHGFTSYKLVDLRGREVRSGQIGEGTTDLRFTNLKNSVLLLRLEGKGKTPMVLRAVTY
jgi:uncharacterized repeat protein (TIGR02543 family)